MEKCKHGVYNPTPGISSMIGGVPEYDMSTLPPEANTNCSFCMAHAVRIAPTLSPAMSFLESIYWSRRLAEEGQGLVELY